MAFTLWALPSLAALLLNTGIGAYVLKRNPGSTVNRTFAIWMAFFALWDLGELGLRTAGDATRALFWAEFLYFGVFFVAPSFAYFVFKLLEKRVNAALLYLPFILLFITLPTGLFIDGVELRPWGYGLHYGIIFPVFGVLFMSLVAYSWYQLWKARSAVKTHLTRKKLNLMLYPTIVAITFGGVTDILLPMLGIYTYTLASLLTASVALGIGYAFLMKG